MTRELIDIFNIVLIYGLQFAFMVGAIILIIRNRRGLKPYLKPGLLVGSIVFVLLIPSIVLGIIYVDLDAIAGPLASRNDGFHFGRIIFVVACAFGVLLRVIQIAWNMLLYACARAEWQRVDVVPPLRMQATPESMRLHTLTAFLIGIIAGIASFWLFIRIDIREGDSIQYIRRLFPAIETASSAILIPVVLSFVSSAALAEELVFRGCVLGWITGKDPRRIRFILGAILTSLAWAIMHIPNTSMPIVKIIQIFVLGIGFAWLTRRSSIHAAMAAHLGLNVATTLLPFAAGAIPGFY